MTALDELLALAGRTRADLPDMAVGDARLGSAGSSVIGHNPELERILALRRAVEPTPETVLAMSVALRTRAADDNGNPNLLRPKQVQALLTLLAVRGLFGPMRVGSGKTLVTLLAPTILNAQRPVMLLPAALRDKTRRDFAVLRRNWNVRLPELVSYQELGQPHNPNRLHDLAPDVLIKDEAQWVRNLDAAVTRRVDRCIEEHQPIVLELSGTLITDKLMDYHHQTVWALGAGAPVPLVAEEAKRWSQAVDKETPTLARVGAGALDSIPGGFHAWLRNTLGVVATPGSDCDASIEIQSWRPTTPPTLTAMIAGVAMSSMRPDGEILDEWELPDVLCQLALGFFYRWDPRPPDWWLLPRRAWRVYARWVLDKKLPNFDSESQIVHALDRADPKLIVEHARYAGTRTRLEHAVANQPPAADDGRHALAKWRAVREQFIPNPVPVWIDHTVLWQAAQTARADKSTIVWVRHRAAGWMLDAMGVPYYGGGTDPEPVLGDHPIACSIKAHGEGKNLQARCRSLVLVPPANALAWEQLIGREHRFGQKADVVGVKIIESIDYHRDVMERVRASTLKTSNASGFSYKLNEATWLDK